MNLPRMLVVTCAVVLTCSAAAAQPNTEEALTATAKELFDAASAARDEGRFDECYAKAKAAWGVQEHYKIAGAIGDCALDVGRSLEAAQNLAYFLDKRPATAAPEVVSYMQKRLADAKKKVATITIKCNIAAATIRIDGHDASAGATIFLEPGPHVIDAQHPGHQPATRKPELVAGTEQLINITLKPVQTPPPPNGNGTTPDEGRISIMWPIATGAIALVGIGIGVAGVVLAGGAKSDVDDLNAKLDAQRPDHKACRPVIDPSRTADCSTLSDAVDDYDGFRKMAAAGFVTSGVFITLTVGLLLFADFDTGGDDEGSAPTSALHIGPIMTPSTQGLVIGGSW